MKMRHRILSIVAAALVGILLISAFCLQSLRQNMLESRQEQILKVARLCTGVFDRYRAQEESGKLTREQAQALAVEALSGLHFQDDYIFVRTLEGRMLVHADPKRVGTIDKGSKTADGRMTSEVYVQDLAKADYTFMTAFVARPGDASKTPVPKLLGAMMYKPWSWVVGNGVFIDDIDAAFWSYAWRFLGIGAVLLVVLGVLGGMLTRSILRQLGGEPQHAAEVVNVIASGDLGREIAVDGPADSLLASMQRMQQGLRDIIMRVRQGSEAIENATAEVASGNLDLSNRTEQAAASLEQTSASMQQLSEIVRNSAEAARQANQFAENASAVANRGGEVVSQVVATMGEISASSNKIADIISVIDGIAFQTNILALNAAVEAARAGEQGRGFAVVAGEVRTLAQRSAVAAREIKELISSSAGRVEQGSALVQQAGKTMEDIVSAVQRVSGTIAEISASAEHQSTSISEVSAAIAHMDQMTQQNAALVEQSAAAAGSLKEQALSLNAAIGTFRLN
jgi:methyl-accepting chemotaxis protein